MDRYNKKILLLIFGLSMCIQCTSGWTVSESRPDVDVMYESADNEESDDVKVIPVPKRFEVEIDAGRSQHKRQEDLFWKERIEMLKLHNEMRASEGHHRKLYLNKALMVAAQLHAEDMAVNNYFSHTGLNGSSSTDRAQDAGYDGRALENIAAGRQAVRNAMQQWMNSPGHHRQIMSDRNYELGIGLFYLKGSKYRYYWVALFGKREAECGNGFIDGDDICDDANKEVGDGCSSTCQVEEDFECVSDVANPISECVDTSLGAGWIVLWVFLSLFLVIIAVAIGVFVWYKKYPEYAGVMLEDLKEKL